MAGEHNGYSSAQMCPISHNKRKGPPDLVPRSHFGGSRTKKQGRGKERRKRDLAKYESKRAPIGCSITDAKAPRVCYFFRSQCKKYTKEVL